jgi:hypothetical protein
MPSDSQVIYAVNDAASLEDGLYRLDDGGGLSASLIRRKRRWPPPPEA